MSCSLFIHHYLLLQIDLREQDSKMLSLSEVPTNFEVQYPSDLGPDADIHEVPRYKEPLYPCINDLSEGGTCSSGEKVFQPDALCIRCEVSDFPVYDSPFLIRQLILL